MKFKISALVAFILSINLLAIAAPKSIQEFDVKPENSPAINKANLQKAIDWASGSGAALWVEPAAQRFIGGGYSRAVVDAVIAKKSFAYAINHTDNAQLIDVFTFGTYGGILLGGESYGQLTNFNLDCVAVGILKRGNNTKNRNWQIAQGSIIANTGEKVEDIHPIIIEGEGHTSLSNVEAFSGGNGALTTVPENQSWDFMLVRGDKKLTVSMWGCRMRNYRATSPITIENDQAIVHAVGCFDRRENLYNKTWGVD